MNYKIIGERIKEARISKGYTQEDIANYIGVNKSTILRYEHGDVKNIKIPVLESIANFLSVNPAWLANKSGIANVDEKSKNERFTAREKNHLKIYRQLNNDGKNNADNYINLLAETPKYTDATIGKVITSIIYFDTPVSAGTGQYLDDSNYIMLDVLEEPPAGAEFIVRVCGDSMEPTYKDGDKLYVNPNLEVNIGDIGIFYVNGDVYVKERAENGLVSHNEKYPKIKFNEYDDIECYGQVIGICKKYR